MLSASLNKTFPSAPAGVLFLFVVFFFLSACSSLAFTTLSSAPTLGGGKPVSGNSLVHCVIKLAGRELGRESTLLSTVFALLATLTLSAECRSVIFKVRITFSLFNNSCDVRGARCSSVVRAFAHGAMGRRIDPSCGEPIQLFLVPASPP